MYTESQKCCTDFFKKNLQFYYLIFTLTLISKLYLTAGNWQLQSLSDLMTHPTPQGQWKVPTHSYKGEKHGRVVPQINRFVIDCFIVRLDYSFLLWSLTSDYNTKTHEVGQQTKCLPEVLMFPYTRIMTVCTDQIFISIQVFLPI